MMKAHINKYYLELSVPNDTTILEYGIDTQPEITAICKGTIFNKEGTPITTPMEGELNTDKLGTYVVFYKAIYKNIELLCKYYIFRRQKWQL